MPKSNFKKGGGDNGPRSQSPLLKKKDLLASHTAVTMTSSFPPPTPTYTSCFCSCVYNWGGEVSILHLQLGSGAARCCGFANSLLPRAWQGLALKGLFHHQPINPYLSSVIKNSSHPPCAFHASLTLAQDYYFNSAETRFFPTSDFIRLTTALSDHSQEYAACR